MSSLVDIEWRGKRVRIEHAWIGARDAPPPGRSEGGAAPSGGSERSERGGTLAKPIVVFLHEGLGSLSMWKDFPQRLCDAAGTRGLVYSRPGYGRSTPRAAGQTWAPRFMHDQAHEVLPALLDAVGVDTSRDRVWLFGHSDGASIALLYAARFPRSLAGAIVAAPHIMVEDFGLASIAKARIAYLESDLKDRLAKYHDDVDSAFWGWNDIWLNPAFRSWSIEDELASIRCPLLAVQGQGDEYGTLGQIEGIARRVPHTRTLELPNCGHSPHRDQPDALIRATAAFIHSHSQAHAIIDPPASIPHQETHP